MAYSNFGAFLLIAIGIILIVVIFYSDIVSNFDKIFTASENLEKQQKAYAEHQKIEISRAYLTGSCQLGYNITFRAFNKGSEPVNLLKSNVQYNGNFINFTSSKQSISPGSYVDITISNLISSGSDRISLITDAGAVIYYGYICEELLCSNDTLFSNWYYNSTYAGQDTNFSIIFYDTDGVSSYRFLFDNCTGTYYDRTSWIDANNKVSSIVFQKTERLSQTVNCTIRAKLEVRDRCDNITSKELVFNTSNLTCIFDANSLYGWVVNSTRAGQFVNVSVNITDNDNISSYVFGLDNATGTYVYDPPVYLNPLQKNLNFSKIIKLNNNVNSLIRLILTVNDSCNISKSFTYEFLTTSLCGYNSEFLYSSYNNTVAGKSTKFSFALWDEDNITGYTFFFDNGTGVFIPDNYISITPAIGPIIDVIKNINSTINSTIRAILMVNDTCGNLINSTTLIFNTTKECLANTSFSSWSVNTTARDHDANFSIFVNDTDGLTSLNFWFDNGTGTYVNDSEVFLSGNPTSYNFSTIKRLNSTVKSTIRAKLSVKDSCNNLINSSELIFNTTYPCPYIINSSESLIDDITCPATAIIINVSNAILDCNYNKVIYGTSQKGIGINVSSNKNNVTIKRCILNGSGSVEENTGIELVSSSNVNVLNTTINVMSNNGTGFKINNSTNISITNVSVNGVSVFKGVDIQNSYNVSIFSSSIESNISVINATTLTFSHLNVLNSYSNLDKSSLIQNVSDFRLVNSNYSNTWQDIINCSVRCNITNNRFANAKFGLNLYNAENLTFVSNHISAVNISTYIRYPGQRCYIADNIFSGINAVSSSCPLNGTPYNYTGCNSVLYMDDLYLCNVINNTAYVSNGHGFRIGYNSSMSNVSYAYAYLNGTYNPYSVMFLYARNFMNYTHLKVNGSTLTIYQSYNSSFKNVTVEKSRRRGLVITHQAWNMTFEDFNVETTNSTGIALGGEYPSYWTENYTAMSGIRNITMRNVNITVIDNYEEDPNNPKLQTWASYGLWIANVSNSNFENIRINRTFNGIGGRSYYNFEPYSLIFLYYAHSQNNTFKNIHFNDTRNQILLHGNPSYNPQAGDIGNNSFIDTINFARNLYDMFYPLYNRPFDNITFKWSVI
ncbi:MAG: hypothetical protein N3E37_05355, partial [Candidatus Micrarchaeota archaeon]|nr:hypothetical protein [Candidatus Micrarchaeota archaeon]